MKYKFKNGGIVIKLQSGRKVQKLFDNVTSKILQNANAKNRNISSITGMRYEQPLKDEHPGLDLALMYAQPGNVAAKAFAPSMAKGLVEGLKEGDLQQAVISGLIPENKAIAVTQHVKDKVAPTPKIWGKADDFLNSDLFQNSASDKQKQFFKIVKEYTNPSEIKIHLQDSPYAKETERTLNFILQDEAKKDLPLSIIRLDDGSFQRLPGNAEELTRIHYGNRNRLINKNEQLITRAHDINLQDGFKPDKLFYGGQGDEGLVLPYAYSKNRVLGDIKVADPSKYNQYFKILWDYNTNIQKLIKDAFKAGDIEQSAKYYVQRMAIPELDKPYLMDRLKRVVQASEYTPATKSVPEDRRLEATKMFRSGIASDLKPNFAIDKSGKLDLSNTRFSIFSGNPENMGQKIVGGYYITPNAKYKDPDLVLKKWKYTNQQGVDYIKRVLSNHNITIPTSSISTDQIGNIFNKRGQIVGINVRDFHHPNVDDNWIAPKLIMVSPENKEYLYRIDKYKIGLKQGGILKVQEDIRKAPIKKEKPRESIPVNGSKSQTLPYPSVLPKESFIDKLRKRWTEMKNETRRSNAFGKFVITREGTKVVDDGGKIA